MRYFWVLAVAAGLGGCDKPNAASHPASEPAVVSHAGEQAAPTPGGTTQGDALEKYVREYANHYRAFKSVSGHLSEGQSDSHALVLEGGHCYRIIAAGSAGVADLDLSLHDEEGVYLERDIAKDAAPMLGVTTPFCPLHAQRYRLDITMRKGQGEYALRVMTSGDSQ